MCLIFVFIFAHMEKAAHIAFLVEQGKAKQIICNPQMFQIKCVALLLFDYLKIFSLDPEATTEDEPLPAIYYAWLVAQENIFLISDPVHVVRFSLSSGCTKMFPHWLS